MTRFARDGDHGSLWRKRLSRTGKRGAPTWMNLSGSIRRPIAYRPSASLVQLNDRRVVYAASADSENCRAVQLPNLTAAVIIGP